MAMYRSTMFFSCGEHGWQEIWYQSKPNRRIALEDLRFVAGFRSRLLGDFAFVRAIRVANVEIPRDAEKQSYRLSPATGGTDVKYPALCLTGIMYGGETEEYRRPVALRGIPSALALLPPLPGPGTIAEFRQYSTVLSNAGMQFRAYDKSVLGWAGMAVKQWAANADGLLQVTTTNVTGARNGDKVATRKIDPAETVGDISALRSLRTVVSGAGSNVLVLDVYASNVPGHTEIKSSEVAIRRHTFVPVKKDSGEAAEYRKRKLGAYPLHPRGRNRRSD